MVASRSFFLATLSAITVQQGLAQTTFTIGAEGCSGLSSDGHCCPGSVIGAGTDSAICCAGDPNLDLINAADGININIESFNGNGQNAGNSLNGPSTCTKGTSTAFDSLPSTASQAASQSSNSATTTTSVDSSGQTCITVIDNGSISQQCNGAGAGDGNTTGTSGSSATPTGSSASDAAQPTSSSSTSGNAGHRAVATAAPLLAGTFMGLVAVL